MKEVLVALSKIPLTPLTIFALFIVLAWQTLQAIEKIEPVEIRMMLTIYFIVFSLIIACAFFYFLKNLPDLFK